MITTDFLRSAEWIGQCTTSVTIDHIPVRLVGVVLEVLREAGLQVEINVSEESK